jgi:hypothetical protein
VNDITTTVFNGAEESFCDAAHLFTTQHSIASTVRAVINLEGNRSAPSPSRLRLTSNIAMGTTGAEMLFQATSDEMISTYANVPYPMGTVVASDVFKTGILLSELVFLHEPSSRYSMPDQHGLPYVCEIPERKRGRRQCSLFQFISAH